MKGLRYILVLFIIGCSSTKVVYDYDSTTNFSRYKTFNFFEDAGKGLNELDIKRVTNALINKLKNKGMHLSDSPDIYINIISKESEIANRNTIGLGIGNGNVGFDISGGIPIGGKKINQQLTIDFVKSINNELIWQGISESEAKERTTPEERVLYYKNIIEKILANYPPKN